MSGYTTDPHVAAAHDEMAARYEQLAEEFDINREDGYRPSVSPEYPKPSAP